MVAKAANKELLRVKGIYRSCPSRLSDRGIGADVYRFISEQATRSSIASKVLSNSALTLSVYRGALKPSDVLTGQDELLSPREILEKLLGSTACDEYVFPDGAELSVNTTAHSKSLSVRALGASGRIPSLSLRETRSTKDHPQLWLQVTDVHNFERSAGTEVFGAIWVPRSSFADRV